MYIAKAVTDEQGNASGGMAGIALKGLTVDFHEPGFVGTLNGENGQPFWFQLGDAQGRQAGSPWGPQNPQALNRYSYTQNNPLRWTDPTGHFAAALAIPLLAITAPAWVVPVAIGVAVVATAAVVAYAAVQVYHSSDAANEQQGIPNDDQPAPASKLREWAKDQGYVQRPGTGTPEGGPETWEDPATGEWKLKLKLPGLRPGLQEGSQKPRYSAKDQKGKYYNPLDGTSGTRNTHGHLPLDPDN